MGEGDRALWRNKWIYIPVTVLILFGAAFAAGWWFAGSGTRSTAGVVDSYTAVYAGSDSPKDVAVLMPLYAEGGIFWDVSADRTYEGTAAIEAALDSLLATRNFDLTVERTLIGDSWAVVTWTANGTRAGTDRLAQASGVTLLEFSKGKIIRETWYYDPAKAPF
jgi:hypothetical protein